MIREEQKYDDLCMILLDPASLILFKPNFPRSMGLENLQPPAFVTRTVALKFLQVIRLSTASLSGIEENRISNAVTSERENDSNFDRHSFKEIVNFIFYPIVIIFFSHNFLFSFFFSPLDRSKRLSSKKKKKRKKYMQAKFLPFLLLFSLDILNTLYNINGSLSQV